MAGSPPPPKKKTTHDCERELWAAKPIAPSHSSVSPPVLHSAGGVSVLVGIIGAAVSQ